MRLTRVRIENLRSIREPIELEFGASIEVLHGDNNSGKSSVLLGIALGLELLGKRALWEEDESNLLDAILDDKRSPADGVEVQLRAPFDRIAPHRDRPGDPIQVKLSFEDDVEVSFELKRSGRDGAWTLQITGDPHKLPPAIGWSIVGADRASQDESFIKATRDPDDAPARRRFREVERALRAFTPELGDGRLEALEVHGNHELAWVDDDGVGHRFIDEGSGLRSIKDILVSTYGSAAHVLLVEEPEKHLTNSSAVRVYDLFRRLAAQPRQLILSSHVHAFDGGGVWRVYREGGATRVRRDEPSPPNAPETDAVSPLHAEQALRRLYGQAGSPHPGFVSRDGLTQVPRQVLDELRAPTGVTWARVKEGAYAMVTLRALRAAEESSERGEG